MTVQAKATSSAPTTNPKNAPSGSAARRKANHAAIAATPGAPKTIKSVWKALANRCAFAGEGWGEATYDGLARDAHASNRSARYAVQYGEAIGLFTVDRRPTAGRGGWNLPNRYRFTLASYDASAVKSFKEWRSREIADPESGRGRVGNFAYPDRGRQIAPGSVRTRSDRDEVHRRAGHSLSGAEHPQAANAGKNGDGRSGCSAPDGPASFGTGSGRDSEQEARADYRACASATGTAAGPGRSTMRVICASADQRGEQGGNGMRLLDANEGDVLERGSERVVIRSVKRGRNFVTYWRVDSDRTRVYTASATQDDASEPANRAARDWTLIRPATWIRLVDANERDVLLRREDGVRVEILERFRDFVTYRRVDGDPKRIYTASAIGDDVDDRDGGVSDWTLVRP